MIEVPIAGRSTGRNTRASATGHRLWKGGNTMLATRLVGLCRLASIIASAAALFACGGGGGGGGSSGPQPSKFFAADSGTSVIGSVINPNPPAGTLTGDRIIQGASTGLPPTMGAFSLDLQNDPLYIGNNDTI